LLRKYSSMGMFELYTLYLLYSCCVLSIHVWFWLLLAESKIKVTCLKVIARDMNKVKYSNYTVDFKLNVAEYLVKHSNRATSHEFTVSEFSVLLEEAEKCYSTTTNKSRKAFRGSRSGKFPE
jgi:predicted metal-binding transcription factor (methanogenesis marker protein 9)